MTTETRAEHCDVRCVCVCVCTSVCEVRVEVRARVQLSTSSPLQSASLYITRHVGSGLASTFGHSPLMKFHDGALTPTPRPTNSMLRHCVSYTTGPGLALLLGTWHSVQSA